MYNPTCATIMRCWVLWIYINTLLATSWLVYHRNILSSWASLHCLVLSGTNNSVWPSHSSRQTLTKRVNFLWRVTHLWPVPATTKFGAHVAARRAVRAVVVIPTGTEKGRDGPGGDAVVLSSIRLAPCRYGTAQRVSVAVGLLPVLFVSTLSRGQAWP